MSIFFIICGICFFGISIFVLLKAKSIKVSKEQQLKEKEQLQQNIEYLNSQKEDILKDCDIVDELLERKNNQYNKLVNKYVDLNIKIDQQTKKVDGYYQQQKARIDKQLEEYQKTTSKAAEQYFQNIQKAYEYADAAHAKKMSSLKAEQINAAAALANLKETRKAAHEALLKQRQIKENKDNYRLLPSSLDLEDIYALEHIKQGLHKPRILSMLIWQTYFQPIAKKQFPIILQDKTKIGIYKITNLKTDQAYIGQSVDIYKRWSDHCKAGLGIDAPVGNKLYKAMQNYGLQNFTFELLCQCSKQQLDEKEKYFIELYQADLYGYNSTKGNK